jgi:hypothetical protein
MARAAAAARPTEGHQEWHANNQQKQIINRTTAAMGGTGCRGRAAAVLMITDVLGVTAGGTPAQVMEYVTVPTPVSVTVVAPEVESVPVQSSPALQPEATQVGI